MGMPFIPPGQDDMLLGWNPQDIQLPELTTQKRFKSWTNGFAVTKIAETISADCDGRTASYVLIAI